MGRRGLVAPRNACLRPGSGSCDCDLLGQRVFARVFGAAIVVLAPLSEIHTHYFRVRLNPDTPTSGGLAEPRSNDGHRVCVCGPFGNEHVPSERRCGPCTSSVTCGPQGHGSHWDPPPVLITWASVCRMLRAKDRGVGGLASKSC